MLASKRNLITIILSVILVAGVAVGGTMAYMTDTQTKTNVFKVGDLELELDEPTWPGNCDLDEFLPGSSVGKDPTVTALKGDAYLRLKVQFLDASGRPAGATQLARILETLYYDQNYQFGGYDAAGNALPWKVVDGIPYNGSDALMVRADGLNGSAYHYTLAQLLAIPTVDNWFNTGDFELHRTIGSTTWLWYKGVLAETESATLFTSIVYPKDWGNEQIAQLAGGYQIVITMEAIQASTFATEAQARDAIIEIFGTP